LIINSLFHFFKLGVSDIFTAGIGLMAASLSLRMVGARLATLCSRLLSGFI